MGPDLSVDDLRTIVELADTVDDKTVAEQAALDRARRAIHEYEFFIYGVRDRQPVITGLEPEPDKGMGLEL